MVSRKHTIAFVAIEILMWSALAWCIFSPSVWAIIAFLVLLAATINFYFWLRRRAYERMR
jgi:hypothetical protein